MDIVGKETLENMLCEYTGTVIFVSHDRYFVNKVADRLLVFENDGAKFYPHGYAEYELIEREKALNETETAVKEKSITSNAGAKKNFSTPLKDKSRKEKRVKKLEELIAKSEEQIAILNKELEKPEVYSDYIKVTEIQEKLTAEQTAYDNYSEEWLTLLEELEQM